LYLTKIYQLNEIFKTKNHDGLLNKQEKLNKRLKWKKIMDRVKKDGKKHVTFE